MCVAYSRPKNLGNIFTYRKIDRLDGPPVSSYLEQRMNNHRGRLDGIIQIIIWIHIGPLCQISILEAGGGSVCGVSMGTVTWFYMLQEFECKTTSHRNTSVRDIISLIQGNGQGTQVVMAPPTSRAPKSSYLYLFLLQEVVEQRGESKEPTRP